MAAREKYIAAPSLAAESFTEAGRPGSPGGGRRGAERKAGLGHLAQRAAYRRGRHEGLVALHVDDGVVVAELAPRGHFRHAVGARRMIGAGEPGRPAGPTH